MKSISLIGNTATDTVSVPALMSSCSGVCDLISIEAHNWSPPVIPLTKCSTSLQNGRPSISYCFIHTNSSDVEKTFLWKHFDYTALQDHNHCLRKWKNNPYTARNSHSTHHKLKNVKFYDNYRAKFYVHDPQINLIYVLLNYSVL